MESLDVQRKVGDKHGTAMILGRLGDLMLEQGSTKRASHFYSAALDLLRESGDREGMAYSLAGLAAVAAKEGRPDEAARAARLFGAARALWAATGTPLNHADTAAYEHHVAAARAYLGEERFEALCNEGAALDVPAISAYALHESP